MYCVYCLSCTNCMLYEHMLNTVALTCLCVKFTTDNMRNVYEVYAYIRTRLQTCPTYVVLSTGEWLWGGGQCDLITAFRWHFPHLSICCVCFSSIFSDDSRSPITWGRPVDIEFIGKWPIYLYAAMWRTIAIGLCKWSIRKSNDLWNKVREKWARLKCTVFRLF